MAKWLKLYVMYPFPTSLMLSNYLKHKSTKLYNKTMKNYVRTLLHFYQFNDFWQIHDKIAETLCLVLKVCPAPRTQALRQRCHWPIAASTIDWSKCAPSSIRRFSSSLTLTILDW